VNFLRRLVLQEKKTWWRLASRCCWNRARPWHASELVSFLVGLRTYQYPSNIMRGDRPTCLLLWDRVSFARTVLWRNWVPFYGTNDCQGYNIASLIIEWIFIIYGMIVLGEPRSTGRKTCPTATLYTINPSRTCLTLNSILRGENQATNRLDHEST